MTDLHKTPIQAAATYIPGEDDVDPDSLAEGKGKEDIGARDMRDENAGDRGGIHTSSLTSKTAAVRDVAANTLSVFHEGRRVAHWEGKMLDACFETGELDPRRIEASAIEAADAAGLLTPSATVDGAEVLDEPEWLAEITWEDVYEALHERLEDHHPDVLRRLGNMRLILQELQTNPDPYTTKSKASVAAVPGEIQSYGSTDGTRWVRCITPEGAQALITKFASNARGPRGQ